jgi:hypothetical protein
VAPFWENAESIFETACQASQNGSPDCDLAILIGPRGNIQVTQAAGWALPSLLAHHGAQTVYHVTRQGARVRLEGRSGSTACMLRSEPVENTARWLLHDGVPLDWMARTPALACPLREPAHVPVLDGRAGNAPLCASHPVYA